MKLKLNQYCYNIVTSVTVTVKTNIFNSQTVEQSHCIYESNAKKICLYWLDWESHCEMNVSGINKSFEYIAILV